MQRLLLKALCVDPLDPATIDENWLAGIWRGQTEDWIQRFCRKAKFSILEPIRKIAGLPPAERQAIYADFKRCCRTKDVFDAGGNFCRLNTVPGLSANGAEAAKEAFLRFYTFLGVEQKSEMERL
ncbi:MAG: hypothetical protein HC901_04625 [Bdellovibrionaceae bacterium]|nr:hypothetical protein [Pseudobdellovibrionaceae bacterium]